MLNPDTVSRAEVQLWSNRALLSVVATTNPNGIYRNQVEWAKEELTRRDIDYSEPAAATGAA